MPGLISNLFDPGDDEQAFGHETTVAGDGETGIALSPTITLEVSGSHDHADGSTSQWSNSTEVGGDVDVDAAFATTTTVTDQILTE